MERQGRRGLWADVLSSADSRCDELGAQDLEGLFHARLAADRKRKEHRLADPDCCRTCKTLTANGGRCRALMAAWNPVTVALGVSPRGQRSLGVSQASVNQQSGLSGFETLGRDRGQGL